MKTIIACFVVLCSVFNSNIALPMFPIQFPLISAPPPPLRAPVFSPAASYSLSAPVIEEFYPINVVHSYVPSKDLAGLFDEHLEGYYHNTPKKEVRTRGRGQGYRQPRHRYPYEDGDDDSRYYGPPHSYGEDYEGPYGTHGPSAPRGPGHRGHGGHSGRKYHGPPRHHRPADENAPHQYGPHRDHFGPGPDPVRGKHHDYVLPRDHHREYYGPPSDGHPRAFSHSIHHKQYITQPLAPGQPCPDPPCDENKQPATKVESLSIPLNPQLSPESVKPGQTLATPKVTHFIETAQQQ